MEKVIVIAGPTAVGKTALSIQLARALNGEIISGDSMQVYRKLDIGTAKVTPEEMDGVPHYLIDICEWSERYSVAEFQQHARQKITEITQKGKLPIVVGGTGLYIQALLYDFKLGNEGEVTPEQVQIKQELAQLERTCSKEELWQRLAACDPLAADAIHVNNTRKVLRALEVFLVTGKSILTPTQKPQALYDYYLIGLTTERDVLYERINQRVEWMIKQGLEEEARSLLAQREAHAWQGIGYKEFLPYFDGQQSLTETIESIQLASRRYAKRQLTWFRNRLSAHWFDLVTHPQEYDKLLDELKNWLEETI
ncbi:tRNA (adenosine(37)-N6)-dimethylallyltransferase MiaA [uncultured Enterococcus sp.]|uniref:tRNA (adenosine(37)-N6)-dimethylallyltransferase MiaA n=1 Tax=uncultured Enterococcus sp. TaxID=167972 RepID=UPI0025E558FA|nr:tRNA (adenosine(37)-N6)-dimethylallyltransferase MiaA [uncultured Enterococcus sp.]